MAPPKKKIDPEIVEAIWAAGVISSGGSLKLVVTNNTKVVRYVITTSLLPGAVHRLAAFMGSNVQELMNGNSSRKSVRIGIQGAALHSVLTRVWDYLTMERKQQYAELRGEITTTTEGPNPYRDGDHPE